ncbi:MAG TPA: sensor histidine kinase [Nitrososphaeraceae archaeon]|nr:sensor histidine kinase [Nitrososphaeraceae archaeon]
MYQRLSKNTSVLVLVAIGLIAIGLSIVSYQYSAFTSEEIRKIGAQDVRSNVEIQAYDIANNLNNNIEAVRSNLALLSSIPAIQNQDIESAKALFSDAQETTTNITSSYFWIDKDGKLLWANSFENQTIYEQFAGGDRSFRPYFTEPRDTLRPYFSSLIESVDAVPRLYIAHPIILDTGQANNNSSSVFNGVVASAIDLDKFGQVLQAQLSTKYGSTLGLIDRNGMILYSSTNATYAGKDVFGDEFQSVIPQEIRASFNSFLQKSLQGSAGSGDISLQGNTSTIAYQPVSFSGDNFAVVYIVAPHNIQGAVGALIDQQRDFNLIVIGSIGAIAVGIAFLILNWNRRLSGIVKSKTAELEKANLSLQEAVEQLKDHDRMQREFINVAAHELRTPTQAIIGYSDLFYLRPESREESIKAISRNAERLESLTRDILDVTRIEGNRLDLNKEKFDISEVVASAIEDTRRRVNDSNIKFEYAPRKIPVEADRMRISQVISNLINNAVKFTKQGTVYISTDNKDGQVVISVKDTGPGIDPEIMPRLFTKFTSKSQTGTGLGLFISKSIIEAHGGGIWAENNKDKKGATVAFRLPLET